MKHLTKLVFLSLLFSGFSHAVNESSNRAIRRVIHKIVDSAETEVTYNLAIDARGDIRLLQIDRNTGTMHVYEINLHGDDDLVPVDGRRRARMLDDIVYETGFVTEDELFERIRNFDFGAGFGTQEEVEPMELDEGPTWTMPQPNPHYVQLGHVVFYHPGYWATTFY
jgi:hypothetical protein